jgi:hypothetical protein
MATIYTFKCDLCHSVYNDIPELVGLKFEVKKAIPCHAKDAVSHVCCQCVEVASKELARRGSMKEGK